MKRLDALRGIYTHLEDRVVVTIMGAVAAELQSLGHRPNFFYLQHAMGLASSMGLGIALSKPERQVIVFDGDGSILMNLGGLTTLARYRPRNLVHVVFDTRACSSVGGFPLRRQRGATWPASPPPPDTADRDGVDPRRLHAARAARMRSARAI
jgi:sulfopyruvate decarboxylase subunit beta